MSGVVVGYVAQPEGRAALQKAAEEAKLRNVPLLVVSSGQTTKSVVQRSLGFEQQLGGVHAELQNRGIAGQVRQLPPEADSRGSHCDRITPAFTDRETAARSQRAAGFA